MFYLSALCVLERPQSKWAPLPSQGSAFCGGSEEFLRAGVVSDVKIFGGPPTTRARQRSRGRAARQGAGVAPKPSPTPRREGTPVSLRPSFRMIVKGGSEFFLDASLFGPTSHRDLAATWKRLRTDSYAERWVLTAGYRDLRSTVLGSGSDHRTEKISRPRVLSVAS
jgi:hypothetical protein